MAVIGPNYEVLWADIGTNGRAADGTICHASDFRINLSSSTNSLNIPPPPKPLQCPYVLTGDDAFGLTTYLVKPFPHKSLTDEEGYATTGCHE